MISINKNVPICYYCGSKNISVDRKFNLNTKVLEDYRIDIYIMGNECYCNYCLDWSVIMYSPIDFYIQIFNDCQNISNLWSRLYFIITNTEIIQEDFAKNILMELFNKYRSTEDDNILKEAISFIIKYSNYPGHMHGIEFLLKDIAHILKSYFSTLTKAKTVIDYDDSSNYAWDCLDDWDYINGLYI